jgi:hypothetical protein
VDVDASVNVIEQVPTVVVGVLINDEIVTTVPTPVLANGPVPGCYFKEESARKPETVTVTVESFDAVAVGGAEMLKAAMLEGTVRDGSAYRRDGRARTNGPY